MRTITLKSALFIVLIISVSAKAQQQNFKLLFHAIGSTPNSGLSGKTSVRDWNHDQCSEIYAAVANPEFSRQYYGDSEMDTIPDIFFYEGPCMRFGARASFSNSLNGDLWCDFLLTQIVDYDTAKVYIYYGSEIPDTLSDLVIIKSAEDLGFGAYLSCGDVNGDGYDDIGISDPNYGTPNMRGKLYIYNGGLFLDTIPDFTITGEVNNLGHLFSSAISIAGDVNNDGFNDIFCMAHSSPTSEGGAYIFFGGNPPDSTPDWHIPAYHQGAALNPQTGAILKDLNGDGYDDIVVGRIGGGHLVFFGGETISATSDLIIFSGWDTADDIQSAGDVNHDGYGDIITADYDAMQVRVFFGGNPMDPIPDLVFEAPSVRACCAGDVNGDGVDDLMYSVPTYYGEARGQIFIWGDTTHTGVKQPEVSPDAASFLLHQNYPNPFNSCTGISFYTGRGGTFELRIYNLQGRTVFLRKSEYPAGISAHLTWEGCDMKGKVLPSGVYFLSLKSGGETQTKKIEILR